MQSIERYGVVALVFLAVTIAAVIMWEDDESGPDTVAAAERDQSASGRQERPGLVSLRTGNRRNLPIERPNPPRGTTRTADPIPSAPEGGRGVDRGGARGDLDPAPIADPPRPVPDPGETTGGGIVPPRGSGRERQRGGGNDTAANIYVVQPNETLSEISMNELGTWRRWHEIVDLNPGLDPLKVRAGVRLVMPERGPARAASSGSAEAGDNSNPGGTAPAPGNARPTGRTWRVVDGDNLWKIAAQTLGDGARWGEIAAANPGMNPDKLTLGQVIQLPANATERRMAPPERTVASATPPTTTSERGRVR